MMLPRVVPACAGTTMNLISVFLTDASRSTEAACRRPGTGRNSRAGEMSKW
jgi:hypothetical protein